MIEEWIFRLDRYLDDSWLDGMVAAVVAGGLTVSLRTVVECGCHSSKADLRPSTISSAEKRPSSGAKMTPGWPTAT